ncbi:ABC transporter-like, ATP-binding domain [Dillenia turbinata]|uniref:ABC transporter-like, ATP-binding domain n=1 Tax=Dillenia turbinata TaxID=194707 RepID=A0AAN8VBB4_9MAGN
MVVFGIGKKKGNPMAVIGGKGVGQILVAVAAALLVRLFSGPGPALLPEQDNDYNGEEEYETSDSESKVDGKVIPVTIQWRNINCSLSDKANKSVRFLLKNVSGEAKPGRLMAIMGPSGSGKTTLLNVLAGQLMASPRLHLSGLLEVNGRPAANKSYKYAYVRQEDLFFSQLTVRETLSLAAELQLPGISSVEQRGEYVNNLLFKLGLYVKNMVQNVTTRKRKIQHFAPMLNADTQIMVSCADEIVGDAKVRGISGGEKKRLSLACELIASPSVIFADEPTTGLDAFQAEKVMETLRQLAQDGHTVICSIHQPRGSIYGKLDDIVLLAGGALVYAGPARGEPLAYFSKFGYQCPDHVNPAEFLADLISIDYSSAENVYSSQKRIDGLVESFAEVTSTILYAAPLTRRLGFQNGKKFHQKMVVKKQGGWWRQFWLLLKRAWMQASRDGPTNKVRARMSIASAIIFGSVFWRMGKSQTSIQDRMGLLQVAAINTAMAALTKTVGVFPKERAIVDRERAKGSYALGPYLLSKLLAEIPIGAAFPLMFGAVLYPMARLHPTLSRFGKFCGIVTVESFAASAMGLTVGAMVPSTEAAMAVGPSLMTVFIVFGGYYVNAENTPLVFRWLPRVSLIRWAFQGLCINEFSGLHFDHQHPYDIQTGEQALDKISFGDSGVEDTVIAQGRVLLFWYCSTYLLLKKNKPKYQHLELPLEQIQPNVQLEPLDTDKEEPCAQPETNLLKQINPIKKLEFTTDDQVRPFVLEDKGSTKASSCEQEAITMQTTCFSSSSSSKLVLLPTVFGHSGNRKMLKVLASRRDEYGREYDGQKVDENMIVLRKRIHEMKIAESDDHVAPSHWMDWEKKYYYANYDSDICEAVGMLQSKLMNTRPSLALGLVALVALSVPTSTVLLGFHLIKMINTMILAGFFKL